MGLASRFSQNGGDTLVYMIDHWQALRW